MLQAINFPRIELQESRIPMLLWLLLYVVLCCHLQKLNVKLNIIYCISFALGESRQHALRAA